MPAFSCCSKLITDLNSNNSCWHDGHSAFRLYGRSTRQMDSRAYGYSNPRIPSTKLLRNDRHSYAWITGWRLLVYATQQLGILIQQTNVGCVGTDILFCHDLRTNVEPYSWPTIVAQGSQRRRCVHSWLFTSAACYWNVHRYVLEWVFSFNLVLAAHSSLYHIHINSQISKYCFVADAMIVLGMILLTEAGQQTDLRKGRFMAIIGLILVAIFFSLILSVFRSKAQGYPYR